LKNVIINAMGTVIRLSINHNQPDSILSQAESKIHTWEKQFSANDEHSDLMKINRMAGIRPVATSDEIFKMIQLGYHATLTSNQKMNILIGPLVKLWKIGFEDAKKPNEQDIQHAITLTNPENLELNEATNEVYLTKKGMEIDLGALVKGYFADQLQTFFINHGVTSGIIDFGGNVITIGENTPTSRSWKVGIRNPFYKNSNPLAVLDIHQQSVVTSGIYERYFIKDHQLYHHILDSKTGYPVNNDIASVTIVSNHSVDCEIWTTICSFGQASQNIELLNQIDGIEGVIVKRDGDIVSTSRISMQKEYVI